jgi:hypothetical protein
VRFVNYQSLDFAFAISVNLMKGMKNPSTIAATTATLNLLLELESHTPRSVLPEDIDLKKIGFLMPFLSLVGKNSNLLLLAGIKEELEELKLHLSKRDSFRLTSTNYSRIVGHISADRSISTLTVSMV